MLLRYYVKGYRSFREGIDIIFDDQVRIEDGEARIKMDWTPQNQSINMIVGANNSGKTNLIGSLSSLIKLMRGNIGPIDFADALNRDDNNQIIEYKILFSIKNTVFSYSIELNPDNNQIISEDILTESGLHFQSVGLFPNELLSFTETGSRTISKTDKSCFRLIICKRESNNLLLKGKPDKTFYSHLKSIAPIIACAPEDVPLDDASAFIRSHIDEIQMVTAFADKTSVIGTEDILRVSDPDKIATFLRLSDTGINDVLLEDLNPTDPIYPRLNHIIENGSKVESNYATKIAIELFGDIIKRYTTESGMIKLDEDYYTYTQNEKIEFKKILFCHDDGFVYSPSEESEGTRRLLEISNIITSNENDEIFIIDELDRKLHTNLTKAIVSFFRDKDAKNQQLIFTTHETRLLSDDILTRQDKWVVDKISGSSIIYNMRSTKLTEDLMADYISGKNLKIFER